jgi:HEAT repeat protein
VKVSFMHRRSLVEGEVLYAGLSRHGPVVIGGPGRNVYQGCFALILDTGGDDAYELVDREEVPFRLIYDHSGRDYYYAGEEAALAGALIGVSVILDREGDDSYRAPALSLGSAIMGAAVLHDLAGDDSYISGAFSQGAAFLGVGIILDESGHDTYVAGMQSQAFGYVMGSGIILDRGGNDTYHTRMAQTDILRYDDHYLSLSQGCAFGSRPDYSGGIGLLIDSRGNDLYSSDIFGQGVAYWFAAGALVDRHGHDYYCSYQYAQGSGVHLAFGLLLDQQGNDFYQSKGVSQGCGHDLSLGLLADFSGNDCYTATDLSQGAGNANGTGILFDADGTDSYSAKDRVNVSGYGNYRRNFGSIGLQVDVRGGDFYSARGQNDSLWQSGMYGLGLDLPGEASSRQGDITVKDYPFEERDFSPEELFILASRGEPRFAAWREFAFDRMVADSVRTIEYLRTVLDTKDARERHTIKNILRAVGKPAVPMLSEAVVRDSDRARAEASWILGVIGDSGGFEALLTLSRSDSWKLRSSALNSLGKLEDLSSSQGDLLTGRIEEVLADDSEVFYVTKDAAYAAGAQGLADLATPLVRTLEADHYSARWAAAEALRELSDIDSTAVTATLLEAFPGLDVRPAVAALHAARDLPVDSQLSLAERATESPAFENEAVKLAVARLVAGLPNEGPGRERVRSLRSRLPEESWAIRSVLSAPPGGK